MTQNLHQLYAERAARAAQDEDLDRVLALVRERVEQRAHRRRNLLAAGGGISAVAILVAAVLIVPGDTSGGGKGGSAAPAGGSGIGASSTFSRSNVLSASATAAATWSPASSIPTVSATSGATAPESLTALVTVGTPAKAPLAVSLVPAGWGYLGEMEAATTYGPPSANDHAPDSFLHKLALLVGTYYSGSFPLTVAGHPARYTSTADGSDVAIRWTKTVQLDVQLPPEAHVTREQALRIAGTLKVRDIGHPAKG